MVTMLTSSILNSTILAHPKKSYKYKKTYDHRLNKIQQKLNISLEYTTDPHQIDSKLNHAREQISLARSNASELRMEFLWEQAVAYETAGNLKAHQQLKQLMRIENQIRPFNKLRKSFKKN